MFQVESFPTFLTVVDPLSHSQSIKMLYAQVTLSILAFLFSSFTLALPTALPSDSDEHSVDRRISLSATRNDIVKGVCKAVTIIFARGTMELGNVGFFAGPPFFNALEILIGSNKLAIQGVDYPATIEGYLQGGDARGSAKLAQLVDLAATKCPDTQIVLSGYRWVTNACSNTSILSLTLCAVKGPN